MSAVQIEQEDNIPDRETCQKLTENFAEITGTDEACAQFYLQDRNWDLERSVNAYYEASRGGINVLNDGNESEVVVTFDSAMKSILETATTTKPPERFRLITWNIDGLDEKNLKKRTKAILRTIQVEKPDIVFLQELIPQTYSYLESNLPDYMAIPSGATDYFTASFLRRTTVYFDSHRIIEYENTLMKRNILFIEAHIGDAKLRLINTHLESTKDFAKHRIAQFQECIRLLRSGADDTTSILAGDLNIRDKEVESAKVPADVKDVWIYCGRRKQCEYTWDLTRNTNKQMPSRVQPRLRFDRVYLSSSKPPTVTPIFFGLVGIEKVTNTNSFPSDHWGLMVDFTITAKQGSLNDGSSNSNSSSSSSTEHVRKSAKVSSDNPIIELE